MLSYVEVNLGNIKKNIQSFKALIGEGVDIMTIVKSNAYGHGIVEVANASLEAGSKMLGVVNSDEALFLRKSGIDAPILIIGYTDSNAIKDILDNDITLSVYDLSTAEKYNKIAERNNKKLMAHLKIDTGLNRMGVFNYDIDAITKILNLKNICFSGIFTHFADAENPNSWQTNSQLDSFDTVLNKLKDEGFNFETVHAGASAATLLFPRSRYNMIRMGISTYGFWPSEETRDASFSIDYLENFELYPALSYKTKIVHIKDIEAGSLVGYGGTFRARKKTKIGVIPVGYAEGFDRLLSNKGEVIVRGKKVKVIGSVCMNMTILNLGDLGVEIGDEVVLIGEQGNEKITAEDIAEKIGTINYEVTTRIPENIKRVYIREN